MSSSENARRSFAVSDTVLFTVLLVIYAVLAVALHSTNFIWDEARYVECAGNLSRGWLASEGNTDFVNGPGYPLVLWPFVASGASLLFARLVNALLIAAAAVLIRRSVLPYAGEKWALLSALVVALHPNLVRLAPYLMTEPLTTFCIAAFAFTFTTALREPCHSIRWIAAAAVAFAYLIMTRVIFGHVVLVLFAGSFGAMLLFKSHRIALARTAVISAMAFALCLPYLAYTKKHTGHALCWSTNGGELLYWATSHYPGENGHWFSYDDATTLPELAPNHKAFIERVNKLSVPGREAEFGKAAREHIREDPLAVAKNWLCNLSRLAFGFPRSFQVEDITLVPVILFNAPLLFLLGLAMLLSVRCLRDLPAEVLILFCFAAIYLGGSSLASGLPRYFLIITPLLWLFIATVLSRRLKDVA